MQQSFSINNIFTFLLFIVGYKKLNSIFTEVMNTTSTYTTYFSFYFFYFK